MALDDETEPVCVYGMDEDVALDRFMDNLGDCSNNRGIYRQLKAADIAAPFVFIAGTYTTAYISEGNWCLLSLAGAVLFGMIAFVYQGAVSVNRNIAESFNQEAERQAKALKGPYN